MNSENVGRIGKPFIIRALGWVGLLLFMGVPSMIVAEWITGYHFQYFPFFAWLGMLLSLPLLLVWILASAAWRISQRHAVITAAGLMRAMREEKLQQGRGER